MTMEELAQWLVGLVSDHPLFASVIAVVGVLRLLVPLVQKGIMVVVGATPGETDDELAEKVFSSKMWNYFLIALDWITSLDTKKLRK